MKQNFQKECIENLLDACELSQLFDFGFKYNKSGMLQRDELCIGVYSDSLIVVTPYGMAELDENTALCVIEFFNIYFEL